MDRGGIKTTYACCRCGYEWTPRSKDPVRCPSCKSIRWNKDVIKDKCLRCGAEWVQKGTSPPKYCPTCHSAMWSVKKVTYTCPKCGLTRTLRSNSRQGLCPVCDRYAESRDGGFAQTPKAGGVCDVVRIWTDNEGLTLIYVNNERDMVYLFAEGDLVGSVNIGEWCRSNKLAREAVIRENHDDSVADQLSKLAMAILYEDENGADHTAFITESRGVTEEQAKILSLHAEGMEPLPISLKLGIPFSAVMDVFSKYVNPPDENQSSE